MSSLDELFAGLNVLTDGASPSVTPAAPSIPARETRVRVQQNGDEFDAMFVDLSSLTAGAVDTNDPAPASAPAVLKSPESTSAVFPMDKSKAGIGGQSPLLIDGATDTTNKMLEASEVFKNKTTTEIDTVVECVRPDNLSNEGTMDESGADVLAPASSPENDGCSLATAESPAEAPNIQVAASRPRRAHTQSDDFDDMFAGLSALTEGAGTAATPVEQSASPLREFPDHSPSQQTAPTPFPVLPSPPAAVSSPSPAPNVGVGSEVASTSMRRGASSSSLVLPPPDKLTSIPSQQAVEYPLPSGSHSHEWHHGKRGPQRARFLSEGHTRWPTSPPPPSPSSAALVGAPVAPRPRAHTSHWGSHGIGRSGEFAHAHFKFREMLGQSQNSGRKVSADESVSSFEEEAMTPGLPLEFDPTDYGGRDSEEDLIAATMGTAGSTPPPPGTDEGGGVGGGDENKFLQGQRKHSDHTTHGVTWERGSGPALALWLEENGLDSSLAPPLAQLCALHTPLAPTSSPPQNHRSRTRSGSSTGSGNGIGGGGEEDLRGRGMSAAERVADLPLGPSLTCLLRHCSLREIVLVAEALNRATVLRDEPPPSKPYPLEPLTTHLGAPPIKKTIPKAPSEKDGFNQDKRAAIVTPLESPSSASQHEPTKETPSSTCPGSCEDEEEASPPWAAWASTGWNLLTGAASVAANVAREEVADFGAPGRRKAMSREEEKLHSRQGDSSKPHVPGSEVSSKANSPRENTVVSQPRASDGPNPTNADSSNDSGKESRGAYCSGDFHKASPPSPSPLPDALQKGCEDDNWQHKVNSLVD